MKSKLFILAFICTALLYSTHQVSAQTTSTVRTKVGNPATSGGSCWPTKGSISQGPLGGTSHARILSVAGGAALDIANSPGTPIYAPFDGQLYSYDCTNRGECDSTYGSLGNYAKIIPDGNPTAIILFGHMMSISAPPSGRVSVGDQIGLMGDTGAGPGAYHLHYEYRGLSLAVPYLPEDITTPSCNAVGACAPASTAAPLCGTTSINSHPLQFFAVKGELYAN